MPTIDSPHPSTPDGALAELLAGNRRYLRAEQQHPGDAPEARLDVALKQEPFAVLVSCADSRVPPELLFDQGFGDIFVVRVAGNVIGRTELGSIEYAVTVLNTPLIMVLGHERCGAVEGAVDAVLHGVQAPGAVADVVDMITPAVRTALSWPGWDLVDKAVRANTEQSRAIILAEELIAERVAAGTLAVVAAYYDLDDGHVELLT